MREFSLVFQKHGPSIKPCMVEVDYYGMIKVFPNEIRSLPWGNHNNVIGVEDGERTRESQDL